MQIIEVKGFFFWIEQETFSRLKKIVKKKAVC